MSERAKNILWNNFPKIVIERRFATEADSRAHCIAVRWSGEPACAACKGTYTYTVLDGYPLYRKLPWTSL